VGLSDELNGPSDEGEPPVDDAVGPAPTGTPTPHPARTPGKTRASGTPSPSLTVDRGGTPPMAVGHAMVNMQTGRCIDVPDGAGTTTDLQMWDCQAVDGQKFSFAADGTMRVLGRCVQIRGTDNGARLRLATCTGSSAQRFGYNSAYDLVNVKTDKCVDVPDGSQANGVTPQIWDCTGQGNQKWRY
jgi:hypothetical protein